LGGTVSSIMYNLIRSIAANFDSFVHILNELNHPFSIIGLTETKLNTSREELSNQYLPGYTFISQPSLSNAGGTGFFINDNLSYSSRSDLSCSSIQFESLWTEIKSNLHHNLICGVIYRHPQSYIEAFSYAYGVLEQCFKYN
jgi:hypothetical protein